MNMAEIENLFAFDFDDTVAITPSVIGVQRVTVDGEKRSFISRMDL